MYENKYPWRLFVQLIKYPTRYISMYTLDIKPFSVFLSDLSIHKFRGH